MFQSGQNSLNRELQIGLNKDRTMFINFKTNSNLNETVYTQNKLKQNKTYFFKLSIQQEKIPVDICVYINGQIEVQESICQNLQTPKGCFYIGSEKASECFQGQIWDVTFYNKHLNEQEVDYLYEDGCKKENQNQILNTSELINFKQQAQNLSILQNKRTGVPMNIVKCYQQDNSKLNLRKQTSREIFMKKIQELKDMIVHDNVLYDELRKMLVNFEWIFLTLQLMSPPIEQNMNPSMFYDNVLSVGMKIIQMEMKEPVYPVHLIEVYRFMKVIQELEINLGQNQVIFIAEQLKVLVHDKTYGYILIYDKFLLLMRNICLSSGEINQLKKNYRYNNPDLEKPKIQESYYYNEDYITSTFENNIPKDETMNEIKIQSITIYVTKETNIPVELIIVHKNLRDGNEITCKHFLNIIQDQSKQTYNQQNNNFLSSNNSDDLYSKNTVVFGDNDLIKKMTMKYSERYRFLIGINFQLTNSDIVPLNFLVDKDGVRMDSLPDDVIYQEKISACEDEYIACIEGALFNQNQYKYIAGIKSYVVKKYLYEKYVSQLDEVNQENDIEELPIIMQDWNQGRFQMIVNHCHNCDRHKNTFIHQEYMFQEQFNILGKALKDQYPNLHLISNFDKPGNRLENFDVYIRGVGRQELRDDKDRVFLYRKNEQTDTFILNFNKLMLQVHDSLSIIIMGYGDTNELEKYQESYFVGNSKYHVSSYMYSKDYPLQIEKANMIKQIKPKKEEEFVNGTVIICRNWGCHKVYEYNENQVNRKECYYHPKHFEFGSTNGYWPEQWVCCRNQWQSKGCTLGHHKPYPKNKLKQLCVNHGEINPKTGYPDSYCGKAILEDEIHESCEYHKGYIDQYINGSEKWSCCQPINGVYQFCIQDRHKIVQWPNEQAKKLFVQKKFIDYSLSIKEQKIMITNQGFSKTGLTSKYFTETKPYQIVHNKEKKEQQKLQETENQPRQCMNWGCGIQYIHAENQKDSCKYHPGRYDFGHTGLKIKETIEEYRKVDSDKILWKPHWTCCRGYWQSQGCTTGMHQGPLVTEMIRRKYEWPSEFAQVYFKKQSSQLWQKKIADLDILNPEKIDKIYTSFEKKYNGNIPISQLVVLCDKLKLYILNSSDDITFHFKFLDVMDRNFYKVTSNGEYINRDMFFKWWNADLDFLSQPIAKQSRNQ